MVKRNADDPAQADIETATAPDIETAMERLRAQLDTHGVDASGDDEACIAAAMSAGLLDELGAALLRGDEGVTGL